MFQEFVVAALKSTSCGFLVQGHCLDLEDVQKKLREFEKKTTKYFTVTQLQCDQGAKSPSLFVCYQ